MTTHRVDLNAPERGFGKTLMSYRGQPIGASDSPIFAAARWLLANGHAGPGDTVATYRGETLCMSGKVGELAKLTVKERDKGRLSLVPWSACPAIPRKAQIPASWPSPVPTYLKPELSDSGP